MAKKKTKKAAKKKTVKKTRKTMSFEERIINVQNECRKIICSGTTKDNEYGYTTSLAVREMFNKAFCKYGLTIEVLRSEPRDITQGGECGVEVKTTLIITSPDCIGTKKTEAYGRGFNRSWSIMTAQTFGYKQALLDAFCTGWEDLDKERTPIGEDFDFKRVGCLEQIGEMLEKVTGPLGEVVKAKPKPELIRHDEPSPAPTEGMSKPCDFEQGAIDGLILLWADTARKQSCTIDRQAAINSIWESNGNRWPENEEEVNLTASNKTIMPKILRALK